MNTCVSDDTVVVNIQGIRHITWGEANFMGSSNLGKPWYLTVTYKGSHSTFYYRTENEARAIFSKIRAVMDKSRKEDVT